MPKSTKTGSSRPLPRARRPPAAPMSFEPSASPSFTPSFTFDDIARRAYELFELDGAGHGRDIDHWLLAERELLGRTSVTSH